MLDSITSDNINVVLVKYFFQKLLTEETTPLFTSALAESDTITIIFYF
jgi:hypothetical protein